MPKPTYPVTIETLGNLIDHGMGASLSCPTCLKAGRPDVRDIDLKQLAERVGRDWCFINRRWPIRCATCGEREVEVRITAPAPSHPGVRLTARAWAEPHQQARIESVPGALSVSRRTLLDRD